MQLLFNKVYTAHTRGTVYYRILQEISLRCVEKVFCKVFYRLLSIIPHFFYRKPLLNKLQDLGLLLLSTI